MFIQNGFLKVHLKALWVIKVFVMSDCEWLEKSNIIELIELTANKVSKDYKISKIEALSKVKQLFCNDSKLKGLVCSDLSSKNISKTRVFKSAKTFVRKQIYYELRTYKNDKDKINEYLSELIQLKQSAQFGQDFFLPENEGYILANSILKHHISTAERLHEIKDFYNKLITQTGHLNTIIDVGCGLHPLTYPLYSNIKELDLYLALDKDTLSTDIITKFSEIDNKYKLFSEIWELEHGWELVKDKIDFEEFDIALMLKLIPVIKRQKPELLKTLAKVPAKKILITGATSSMTKRVSIEKRERGIIRSFIDKFNFKILSEFELQNEVGWLVKRS